MTVIILVRFVDILFPNSVWSQLEHLLKEEYKEINPVEGLCDGF